MTEQDAINKGYTLRNYKWYRPKYLGGNLIKSSLKDYDKSTIIFNGTLGKLLIQISRASEIEPFWKYTETDKFQHRLVLSVQVATYPLDTSYKCLQIIVGRYVLNTAIFR